MKYALEIPPSVEKEIRSLPRSVQERIHASVLRLEANPRPPGSKRLLGSTFWRIRVGDYRVVYDIDDESRTVTLTRARHRKEVYRGL